MAKSKAKSEPKAAGLTEAQVRKLARAEVAKAIRELQRENPRWACPLADKLEEGGS